MIIVIGSGVGKTTIVDHIYSDSVILVSEKNAPALIESIGKMRTAQEQARKAIDDLINQTIKQIPPETFFEKTNHIPKGLIIRNKRK